MKAATAIGIVVALVGLARGRDDGGQPAPWRSSTSPALLIVLGGTLGAVHGLAPASRRSSASRSCTRRRSAGDAPDLNGRAQRARRLRRARPPRRPAGARRRGRRRSRTSSPRRACSSSSTAPTPTSSPTSSRPRTTPCARATPRPRKPFEKAGGFAPTMGIIGTVLGLVHVLENLDNPETLGPAISAAFIATLLGVALGQRHLPARSAQPPEGALQGRGASCAR